MASRKSSYILPTLFLLCLLLGIAGGAAFLVKRLYNAEKASFQKAFSELPAFDIEEASRAAAAELGFAWPLEEPKSSLDAVGQALEASVKRLCDEKFSTKELSKKIFEVVKKYSAAKPGDKVKFQIAGGSDVISGKFLRVEDGGVAGRFVVVDNGVSEFRCPYRTIMPEYYYLFSESDSSATQEKLISQLKSSFEAQKEDCAKALMEELEPKLFAEAGYVRRDSKWVSKPYAVAELAEGERKKFEKERVRKIEDLKRRHAFLGVFQFDVPKSSAK